MTLEAINPSSLVNGIYPLDYFTLSGVKQVAQPNAFWWSSAERYASIDEFGNYQSAANGGTATSETLEIDLGRIREVNYINFDILRAPIDIVIEFDALSTPDRTPVWKPTQQKGDLPYEDATNFSPDNRNAWHNVEFNLTDQNGNMVHTRYLRLTFERRDEAWPTSSALPFPWAIFVQNLRVGRYVSELLDTIGPLLSQDTPSTLNEVTLPAFGQNSTHEARQQFVVPTAQVRIGKTPNLLGFGILVQPAIVPQTPDLSGVLTTPQSGAVGQAALDDDILLGWSLYDVTDPTQQPTLLRAGTMGPVEVTEEGWIDVYLDDHQIIPGDTSKVYEFRVSSLNQLSCNTVLTTTPNLLSTTPLPGTLNFTNGLNTVVTTQDLTSLLQSGDYIIRMDIPDQPFLVTAVASNQITLSVAYAGDTSSSSGSIVYPFISWTDLTTKTEPNIILSGAPSLFWRLDDQAGTTAADGSGNSHSGTYGSGVTLNQTNDKAVVNSTASAYFNNTSNAHITSSYSPFTVGSQRTFMGWAYRNATTDADQLFGSDGVNPAMLRLEPGSEDVKFWAETSTGGGLWSAAWPGTSQWVHWAVTYDDSTSTAELFINGTSQGSKTTGDVFSGSSGHIVVGGPYSSSFFNGYMQDFAVFEYILTSDQIAAIYNGSFQPPFNYTQDASQNLVMRIWSDIADDGQDVLGNVYRHVVRTSPAENVIIGKDAAGWMSDPFPTPEAVEALYFDVRHTDPDTSRLTLTLIEALQIAPRTPGVKMNVYWTAENVHGDRPVLTEEWDNLYWTPVTQTYTLRRNEIITLPQPFAASFVKLEFSGLQPLPYNLPDYPRLPPVQFRTFPTWVNATFQSAKVQQTIQDWFLRNATPVQQQVLKSFSDPVREFQYQQQTFLAQLALGTLTDQQTINSGLVDLADKALVDPTTASKIYVSTSDQYGSSLTVSVDQSSVLGKVVAANYDLNRLTTPTENQNPRSSLGTTVPIVSTINDRISQSFQSLAQTPMRFYKPSRHIYTTEQAEFNKKAYFVGIDKIRFLRIDYTSLFDDALIQDILYDDVMLESNTWTREAGTAIPEDPIVYVSYEVGDTSIVDEPVELSGANAVQLATIGAPARNIFVFAGPNYTGVQYFQNYDYEIGYGRDSFGNLVTYMERSLYGLRMVVPLQPLIYNDVFTVIAQAIIPSEPFQDTAVVTATAVISGFDGQDFPTYGSGTYGGTATTGEYDDLRKETDDAATVVGTAVISGSDTFVP